MAECARPGGGASDCITCLNLRSACQRTERVLSQTEADLLDRELCWTHHGDLRQSGHVDPGEGLQLPTLTELLQNLLETLLELGLVLLNQALILLPLGPVRMVLLREVHPQNVQVLGHLEPVTNQNSVLLKSFSCSE